MSEVTNEVPDRLHRFAPLGVIAAGLLAYANSFGAPFIFDDINGIANDPTLTRLSSSIVHTTRPLTRLTFHLQYRFGLIQPADYRIGNVLIHILAGLFLLGVVRRTLDRVAPAWTGYPRVLTGMLAAALWVAHPVQTESVTYLSQRAETLMGMLYLGSLYAFVRGCGSARPAGWFAASVAACLLGMGAKPVMVTAPLMILLYDRWFAAGSVATALRKRWPIHLALWLTLLLPACILSLPNESSSTTLGARDVTTPLYYFLTQQGVMLHYLRLAVWPVGLCLDYVWPVVASPARAAVPGLIMAALWGGSLWLAGRRSSIGFLALWFLLILLPSSSVIPIADCAVEHRLYLSLAGIAVGVVLAVWAAGDWLARRAILSASTAGMVAGLIVSGLLGVELGLTHERNRDYGSEERMWLDVIAKRPQNPKAYIGLTRALLLRGENEKVVEYCTRGLESLHGIAGTPLKALLEDRGTPHWPVRFTELFSYAALHDNCGLAQRALGRKDEALQHFMEAYRITPGSANVRVNLASMLFSLGRTAEALQHLRYVTKMYPNDVSAQRSLGEAYFVLGDLTRAIPEYRRALEIKPDDGTTLSRLAWILATAPDARLRDGRAACGFADRLMKLSGASSSAAAWDVAAAAYAEAGDFQRAVAAQESAVALPVAPESGGRMKARLERYRAGKPYRDDR